MVTLNLKSLNLSQLTSLSRPTTPTSPSSTSKSSILGDLTPPSSIENDSPIEKVSGGRNGDMHREEKLLQESKSGIASISTLGATIRRTASSRETTPALMTSTTTPKTTSEGTRGLLPLRTVIAATTASLAKKSSASSAPKGRPLGVTASAPLLTPFSSTSHSQVHSQPPLLRQSSTASVLKSFLPSTHSSTVGSASLPGSKRVSPTHTPIVGGGNTPLPNQSMSQNRGLGGQGALAGVNALEESYVGKVSQRLGEAVNRMFLPGPVVPGVPECVVNGRSAPKDAKGTEIGEIVRDELHRAQHDSYLLRTLLRSSVLKSLSLSLSRLTTLLLPPSSCPPLNLKDVDALPVSIRFNLAIVRCAYQIKEGLRAAGQGTPHFVSETLKPWIAKFEELMAKVMGPLVIGLRITISSTCAKAREIDVGGAEVVKSVSGRSLSIGRSAPAPIVSGSNACWIKELSAELEAAGKLLGRMECGRDAEKWLVSIGTCAIWKGMLALSARSLVNESNEHDSHGSNSPVTTSSKGIFKAAPKRSPSPPRAIDPTSSPSPTLAILQLEIDAHNHVHSSAYDGGFLRLLGDLESFEARLIVFVDSLPHSTCPPHAALLAPTCIDFEHCGLCKTGRRFDAESSDSDDEEGGGLAQCAMREAMQALSSMIVVVRASSRPEKLRLALVGSGDIDREEERKLKEKRDSALLPMTPSALLNMPLSAPVNPPSATLVANSISLPTDTTCQTLLAALDTIPTLILLHLITSRLPSSLHFQLPYQIWNLDYTQYAKELRGFAAAEEWTEEIAWEMSGEMARIKEEGRMEGLQGEGRLWMKCLAEAIKKVGGVEVCDI